MTNDQGVTTAIAEDIGEGTVVLRATHTGRVSPTQNATWVCGECHCTVEPNQVTLTLSP